MTHKKVDIPLEGVEICQEGIDSYREYRFKFIVISTYAGEEKFLRGPIYDGFSNHAGIVQSVREQEGLEGHVSGGWIQIHPKRKRIYAFGHSVNYGPASSVVVRRLLKEYCLKLGYEFNVIMDDIANPQIRRQIETRRRRDEQFYIELLRETENPEHLRGSIEDAKMMIETLEDGLEENCMDELKRTIEEIEGEGD